MDLIRGWDGGGFLTLSHHHGVACEREDSSLSARQRFAAVANWRCSWPGMTGRRCREGKAL